MCELFALSSKLPTRVTFSLEEFSLHGGEKGPHRDGWGLAFYDGACAQIFREVRPAAQSEWLHFLQQHQHQSQCVISHIRRAIQGEPSLRNTQPFSRELAGQQHVFCHNGNLQNLPRDINPGHYTPIGETDSETVFCSLMGKMEKLWAAGEPTLAQRAALIKAMFDSMSELGPANFLYSDGDYLYAYANKRTQAPGRIEPPGMHYLCRDCDRDQEAMPLAGVDIQHNGSSTKQAVVLFASVPLSNEKWLPFAQNQLIIARNGRIIGHADKGGASFLSRLR